MKVAPLVRVGQIWEERATGRQVEVLLIDVRHASIRGIRRSRILITGLTSRYSLVQQAPDA